MDNVDIFINGYGIGSSILALRIAQKCPRLKIVICETSKPETIFNGADLLKPSGIAIIKELGLLPEILSLGVKRKDLKIFYSRQELIHLDYSKFDELGYFILLPYPKLLSFIRSKLKHFSNVEIHYNTHISHSEKVISGAISSITLSNGKKIIPKVVIGADGAKSKIRKILQIEGKREIYDQIMYLTQLPLVESIRECNRLYVEPGGSVAYFYPISKFDARVVIGFLKEDGRSLIKNKKELIEHLYSFVSESPDALDIIKEIDFTLKKVPVAKMHISKYFDGNSVLLGDACHNINPITGQGMNLAIEDAGLLSTLLEEFFTSQCKNLKSYFEKYQEIRFPINEKMVTYGDKLSLAYKDAETFKSCFNPRLQGSSRHAIVMSTGKYSKV
jgi:HQNO biosynthesis monooxygenase PqsL